MDSELNSELKELELQARAGDEEAFKKLQAHRERIGFGPADAEYLHKYLELCELFINGKFNLIDLEGDFDTFESEAWDELYKDPEFSELSYQEKSLRVETIARERNQKSESKLGQLNQQYKFLVHPKTLKFQILARKLAGWDGSDGWAISSIC